MVQACHNDLDYLKMSLNLHVLPNFMVSTVPALRKIQTSQGWEQDQSAESSQTRDQNLKC